jgi:hypothetical protein
LDIATGTTVIESPADAASPIASSGCMVMASNGDGEGGFVHLPMEITDDATINNETSFEHHFVPSTETNNDAFAYLNTSECLSTTVDNGSNTSTDASQPYLSIWRARDLTGTIALVPVTVGLRTNVLVDAATDNACFQLFDTDTGNVSSLSQEERKAKKVFEYVSEMTQTNAQKDFYLPRNDSDEYDAFIKPIKSSESCGTIDYNIQIPAAAGGGQLPVGYSEENFNYSDLGEMFVNPT